MSFQQLKATMHWPAKEEIYSPLGAGPRVLVRQAQEKIGKEIQRQLGQGEIVRVGLLTKASQSDLTTSPIAIVCEFNRHANDDVLEQVHRLAWNFSRAPLLITIEPNLIRTWTCCEVPSGVNRSGSSAHHSSQIHEATLNFDGDESLSNLASHALNWVRLASGEFYDRFPDRFRRDQRADQILLDELKDVRRALVAQDLPQDIIHDLIARVIFAQFLFDRKDSEGRSALNSALLKKLFDDRILTDRHDDLRTILSDHDEAYRFFKWLNAKFNGDLFPGKGATRTARETEWRYEKRIVQSKHLKTLADFVGGTVAVRSRQQSLWRQYSFDVIPLDFISSIYEEFVTDGTAHYTPGYLVDFILDGVLPWDGTRWDIKILDPACGSGIFLVKAYQRLIQRWKNAHNEQQPTPSILRRMLERNLFGVDKDEHAVRVASFSLYLTMCDEIDPKSYLSVWKFPRMRGKRLISSDFFEEHVGGFDTTHDAGTYDLVIGNAPWGKDTITPAARAWATKPRHDWKVANNAIGTLFMAKAGELISKNGYVSIIQPASSFLFNTTGTAKSFREKFFSNYSVREIVNLSALRFQLFGNSRRESKSVSPPCVVSFTHRLGRQEPVSYICPKRSVTFGKSGNDENNYLIVIEPSDVNIVPASMQLDPYVWTALAWGSMRDYLLLQKLGHFTNLERLECTQDVLTRRGVSRGSSKRKLQPQILDMPIIDDDKWIDPCFRTIDATALLPNDDPYTHEADSVDMSAFSLPQLIVKQSWQKDTSRFKCVIVDSTPEVGPVFCTRSYFSIHVKNATDNLVDRIWASINSTAAVYFLLLTSGRLASWIPEPNKADFLRIPIAPTLPDAQIENHSDLDQKLLDGFGLKDSEKVLVQDLFDFTMPDFQGNKDSPGRQRTLRSYKSKRPVSREPQLYEYCKYFLRVLKSVSGCHSPMSATIFQDAESERLPVRLVAFYLAMSQEDEVTVEVIESDQLCRLLEELNEKFLEANGGERGGIFFQRVARVYIEQRVSGRKTPVVYIIKPDCIRYWSRSAGLRDADEVAADAQLWRIQDMG